MGIAYYYLGELDKAKDELELSIAYKKSKDAEEFLEKVLLGIPPVQDIVVQEEIIEQVIEEKPIEVEIEEKPEEVAEEPEKKEEVKKEPEQVVVIDKDVIERERDKPRLIIPP